MIPPQAVEAAAKAIFERNGGRWDNWTPEEKAEELEDMRTALEAAAPHMLSHERGQTRLAQAMDEALAIHAEGGGHCDQCGTTYPCSTVKALALRETE